MDTTRDICIPFLITVGFISVSIKATASTVADRPTPRRVIVRIYDSTSLPLPARMSTLAAATHILRAAGLDVVWRPCDAIATASSACEAPLSPGEIAIRFLPSPSSPPGGTNQMQLGYSIVDTTAHSGSLATIYVDRVRKLARDAGTRADVLLGRAIAHEIGHLLLGTTSHARKGLMRGVWSTEALQRDASDDWLFSARDARSLRRSMPPTHSDTH